MVTRRGVLRAAPAARLWGEFVMAASAARGRERTLLLIDEDAAALVDRG